MNTPPRKLLNVEKMISPISPGTAITAPHAALKSTALGVPSACTMVGSGIRISARWTVDAAIARIEIRTTGPRPSCPIARPDSTPVTSIVTPLTVPTMPLALTRRSDSISIVTQVDSANPRIIASSAPARIRRLNSQNHGLERSISSSSGTIR